MTATQRLIVSHTCHTLPDHWSAVKTPRKFLSIPLTPEKLDRYRKTAGSKPVSAWARDILDREIESQRATRRREKKQ